MCHHWCLKTLLSAHFAGDHLQATQAEVTITEIETQSVF